MLVYGSVFLAVLWLLGGRLFWGIEGEGGRVEVKRLRGAYFHLLKVD
jgi:hypothetical protein